MISIHKRLLLWLLTGLLAISSIAGIATYRKMLEEVNEMQDFELRQVAYAIEYASRALPASVNALKPSEAANPAFLVQLWRSGSRLQYSSQPAVALPLATVRGFSFATWNDDRWRVFSLAAGDRIVQTAQSVEDRQETAADMSLRMLMPFLVLVPVLAVLVLLAVRRGLSPLGQIADDIARRDSTSMQPLNEETLPAEIRPLIVALNDLLRRLAEAMNAQRRFVADAAHELRTPLTALTLQAQLVQQSGDEDERRRAVGDLRQGIARASHMVQQLLDMAHQEPDSPHAFSRLDLTELVREKVGELAPLAAAKDMDLGVKAEHSQWINGNADSLRILVGNLVDNAIRYTQAGGKVDVSVGADDEGPWLTVADNGPGIPEDEHERIFERFYRPAGQHAPGSGLGLSIVRQVAQLHQAKVRVERPPSDAGILFRVVFSGQRAP
jgi:two-component system, OmpR family, sensor kinase